MSTVLFWPLSAALDFAAYWSSQKQAGGTADAIGWSVGCNCALYFWRALKWGDYRGREPSPEKDVYRGASKGRDHPGGDGKKVVKPSRRREMAQQAVRSGRVSIKLACLAFGVSTTCYRYQPRLSAENAEIADHLIRLTPHPVWHAQCLVATMEIGAANLQ